MKTKSPLTTTVIHWLDRWQLSETVVLGGTALLVGLLSGSGVWLFKRLTDLAHSAMFGGIGVLLSPAGTWTVAVLPVFGGLVVGLILHFFVGVERHHGVASIIESVALAGGRLYYRLIPAKTLASAVSIGGGASVGPEDPSVQIGANLGSMLGRWFRLSDERVRTLVAAGAAGGFAAAFNAPTAGVFFALEIILGEISSSALGLVILSAISSAVFTQAVSGPKPAFNVPGYAFNSALELPLYLGLGLLAGPVSAAYVRFLYTVSEAFHAWKIPRWLKPACAGLLVGIVGIALPQVFGVGYGTIEKILGGASQDIRLLIALLVAKLILTMLSIGGGFAGGVIAPSLFIGATLGAAYGIVCGRIFPTMGIAPPAFAMVGMAAVLAGTVRAPLTAILLLFEMTTDYHIILPLMFAVMVSLKLSQRLESDSVYTIGLSRKGIRLQRGRDLEVLDGMRVGEIMQTDPAMLQESDSLATAADIILQLESHGLPVVNHSGELTGILTVQDIETARMHGEEKETVGQLSTRELLTAYPDETLGEALRRMSVRDVGSLPVVMRENPRRLVGVLRRADIIRAYELALIRRTTLPHRARQARLGEVGSLTVEEIKIKAGAACIGKHLCEIAWPRDCVITTVRRREQVLIPHADTVLQTGDVIAVVAEKDATRGVRVICGYDGE